MRALMRVRDRDRYTEIRDWLWAMKSCTPCTDCGQMWEPWQMQFDHRDPSQKTANVMSLIRAGMPALEAELAKCDIVCANCHMTRTYGPTG